MIGSIQIPDQSFPKLLKLKGKAYLITLTPVKIVFNSEELMNRSLVEALAD